MEPSRQNIEFILANDLGRARAALDDAKAQFRPAIRQVPSGISHHDGAHGLTIAGESFRSAMEAYAAALREFNGFIIHGVIPDRLRTPTQTRADSARQA